MSKSMTALVRYEALKSAIAEALTFNDVKDIRDKAEAMRAYAHMANDAQLELDAGEIRLRAERRLGELLIAAKNSGHLHQGGRPRKTPQPNGGVSAVTLDELGISYNLSSDAQMLAALPEHTFEEILIVVRSGSARKRPASAAARKRTRAKQTALQRVEKLLPKLSDSEWDDLQLLLREEQRRRKPARLTLVGNSPSV
jgi:hypothetical protein